MTEQSVNEESMEIDLLGDIPKQIVNDLITIAKLSEESIRLFSETLARESGYLTSKRLDEVVARFFPQERQAAAVITAVTSLSHKKIHTVIRDMIRLQKFSSRNQLHITAELIRNLEKLLPVLIQEYPALMRQRDAQFAALATGMNLKGVALVCDLRPLLEDGGKNILGLIPLATLRLSCTESDGSDKIIELVLSQSALRNLAEAVNTSKMQLEGMRNFVDHHFAQGWIDLD